MRSFLGFCVSLGLFLGMLLQQAPNREFISHAFSRSNAAAANVVQQSRGLKPTEQTPQERGLTQTERGLTPAPANALTPSPAAQSYALVIGVSKYPALPSSNQLRYAAADAMAVHDFLISDKGGFRKENVTLLVDDGAKLDLIKRSIDDLLKRSGRDGIAVIFFAGHGYDSPSGLGYLLASNSQPEDLSVTALEMALFKGYIQGLKSRGVVVISDACHSGKISDTQNSAKNAGVLNLTAAAIGEVGQQDQSTFILSAATGRQSSYEDD